MRRIVMAALVACITGCASTGPAGSEAAPGQICTEEQPLGSHIKQRRCRTVKQYEREQRDAGEVLRNPTVDVDGTTEG